MELLLGIILALDLVILAFLGVLLWRPLAASLILKFESLEQKQARLEQSIRQEFQSSRAESTKSSSDLRLEVSASIKNLGDSLVQQMKMLTDIQRAQLERFSASLEALRKSLSESLESSRKTSEEKFAKLMESNEKKLEEMRLTVDEKLQGTLEKRLGESFNLVSERLEQVHKGLGEMQSLATGVGDLKKVLTNVKTRGTWGEIQLGNLLEEMLSPEQFERNVQIRKRSPEIVEFAVRLPGPDDLSSVVYLPIDSKFPKEDYERLQAAHESADLAAAEEAGKALEAQIKKCGRDIRDKYIHPPHSTDFAIMFLPVESLFAEVLRRPGLAESLQRDFRVAIAGPTTLAALLNSLQMGFRTLAIQKSSSEVWKILGAVKSEFSKFGGILDRVKKQLEATQNTISEAASKTRHIERKLRTVEDLPHNEVTSLLGMTEGPQETQ